MQPNTNLRGNSTAIGLILVLLIICSVTAYFAFNTQNTLNRLQSNYDNLAADYSNLQNKLNNLESSLNEIENDLLLNSSQERISISRVSATDDSSVSVWVRSLTGVDIVIVDAVIRDSSGNIVAQNNRQMPPTTIPAFNLNTLKVIAINFPNAELSLGTPYSITLITEKGTSFTYNSFTK